MDDWIRDAEDKSDPCRPFFYMGKLLNAVKSRAENRRIYDDVEFVRIDIPGESKLRPDRPVQDEDKARWPKQYAAFKAGQDQPIIGTPLENWPVLSPAQVETYRSTGRIRTVEDIAGLTDSGVELLGPNGYKIREAAKAFVAPRPSREKEMQAELDETKRQLAAMQAQIAQLTGAGPVTPATAPPPKAPATAKKAA
jgi:hypothetical protein